MGSRLNQHSMGIVSKGALRSVVSWYVALVVVLLAGVWYLGDVLCTSEDTSNSVTANIVELKIPTI